MINVRRKGVGGKGVVPPIPLSCKGVGGERGCTPPPPPLFKAEGGGAGTTPLPPYTFAIGTGYYPLASLHLCKRVWGGGELPLYPLTPLQPPPHLHL